MAAVGEQPARGPPSIGMPAMFMRDDAVLRAAAPFMLSS